MKKAFQLLSLSAMLSCSTVMASAQTTETVRIMQLEETVRTLNGQIEELRFQVLQMQENLRKMQEDNEFRFQELEDQSDASGSDEGERLGKPLPSEDSNEEESGGERKSITDLIEGSDVSSNKRRVIDGVEIFDPDKDINFDSLNQGNQTLGTITFDAEGNLVDNNIGGGPIPLIPKAAGPSNDLQNLPENPTELFDLAYQYFLGGDHDRSAEAFRVYVDRYPDGKQLPNASFWLGESLFTLKRYPDAARVFLNNHKQFPNARMAPQNLLKLGVSLAAMNQRELACATYAEVPKLYPSAAKAIQNRVKVEQRSAKCQG